MGGRPPACLELLVTPQKVVGPEPFGDALPDGHPAQYDADAADALGPKMVIKRLLEGMQNAAKREAELSCPDHPIHLEMIEAQPAAAQESVRDVLVEGPLARMIEGAGM